MEMCMIAEVYGVSFDFIHDICVSTASQMLYIYTVHLLSGLACFCH